jgi:hypothetical protein
MKLARTKDAIAVCVAADEMLGGADSAESLISRTRVLLLQAKVYTRAGQAEEYAKCLVDANALQSRVLARLRGEAGDLAREQRKVAAYPQFTYFTSTKVQTLTAERHRWLRTSAPSLPSTTSTGSGKPRRLRCMARRSGMAYADVC